MFNIQHPDDWCAWSEDYQERKELMEEMAKFAILHHGEDCWQEEKNGEIVPWRFPTKEAAEMELVDYLRDQHQAVDDGDMDYKYQREEFDIVEVER